MKKNPRFKPLAAEYALGVLEPADQSAVERRLQNDAELQAQVSEWQNRLAPLAEAVPDVTPPVCIWEQLEARIDRDTVTGMATVRADQGEWQVLQAGVMKKLLHSDPLAGFQTYLIRIDAETHLPPHPHRQLEECYMLEGEMQIGDLTLRAHDYHIVQAGTPHAAIYSRAGALLLVRGEVHDVGPDI